jgi:signal transduction histidine kinase
MWYNIWMAKKPAFGLRLLIDALCANRKVIAVLVACAVLGNTMTYVLYNYTQFLLTERLQERLIAIASTAATQFDGDELETFQVPADMRRTSYTRLVDRLSRIRDTNADIQFVYLMRRTDDPSVFEFIADTDTLTPVEELDIDGDGILSETEVVPLLGDPYPVDDYPVLRDEAFYHPAVDRELIPDQWGLVMAAYSPIYNSEGDAVAVIGVDVLVDDFVVRTQATLLPFMLFIIALILLLTLLTMVVFRYQHEQVRLMEELDRQKDELLSMVSHQLATPISSMKWYIEMLLDGDAGKLNEEQTKELETMQRSSKDLADLVSMILDVSRIQLGRMKVDRAPLALDTFFEEVCTGILTQAKEKGVIFDIHRPKVLPTAMLDRRLMRMTLENLLTNAVKYTPKGGKVTLTITQPSHDRLHYVVKDSGCGIPKEDQDKIFGKLFRATNVRNTIEGNGFGLYVAKGAVESQSGSIGFESAEGKGTTFTVELPLVFEADKKA